MSLDTAQALEQSSSGHRLGLSLLVIATAQLMLVLDDSMANVALPTIQHELAVDPAHLPWIVNGYILTFGALLLLGGRIGDLWGSRRTLPGGLALSSSAPWPEAWVRAPRC